MRQPLAVSPLAAPPTVYPDVPLFMQRPAEQADRLGLPPIGSRLSSSDGMQWVVIDHIHAPNLVSYARNRGLSSPRNSDDLVPRVAAEQLSQRLLDFWIETDRCTSKAFLIVDTLPHLRPQYAFRHGHSVDAWSVPGATLFAFDFANIHESIIAHEIAHVWIDLVEDCEDYRSPVNWLDTARAQQILFIQSFVLDCKVNQVVRERGFDLSIFAEHSRQAISNFTKAVLLGHRPPTQREAVLNALMIASALLEHEDELHGKEAHTPVLCYDGSMASALRLLRAEVPEIYDLAECFVTAVQHNGTSNREQIRHAIDDCLTFAFEFTGDPLDLKNELCEEAPNETYQLDKTPDFLPGWPVRAKIEANRIRAKLHMGNNAPHRLSQSFSGAMQIEFLHPCGAWTSPVMVPHAPYVPQFLSPQEALPPGLRHLSPAVLNLLPEKVRTQQPPKMGVHAAQVPMTPVATPQVPQLPVIPALPDMSASWLGASSKPPYGRSYMAGVGLWLSEARLQEQLDLREHPYGYAENNPLANSDPTGFAVCGPDVTWALESAVRRTKAKYQSISPALRALACSNIASNPLVIINSWDTELHDGVGGGWLNQPPYYNVTSRGPCCTPQSTCGGTVSVNGVCYDAGSVNYVIDGVMLKLCGTSMQRLLFLIDAYKGPHIKPNIIGGCTDNIPPAGNWFNSRRWAVAGYNGWPAIGPGISPGPSNRPHCSVTCPHTVQHLRVKWLGIGQF